MDPILDQVIKLAAAEFQVGSADLSGQSSPDSVPGWDSEAQLRLAMSAEEAFGISLDIDEFESITSLASLSDLIRRKQATQ